MRSGSVIHRRCQPIPHESSDQHQAVARRGGGGWFYVGHAWATPPRAGLQTGATQVSLHLGHPPAGLQTGATQVSLLWGPPGRLQYSRHTPSNYANIVRGIKE
jgi:hypothetical protein